MTRLGSPAPRVRAVVLAAGAGVRFGGHKLEARVDGQPILQLVLDALAEAGLEAPLVVVGPDGPGRETRRARMAERGARREPRPRTGPCQLAPGRVADRTRERSASGRGPRRARRPATAACGGRADARCGPARPCSPDRRAPVRRNRGAQSRLASRPQPGGSSTKRPAIAASVPASSVIPSSFAGSTSKATTPTSTPRRTSRAWPSLPGPIGSGATASRSIASARRRTAPTSTPPSARSSATTRIGSVIPCSTPCAAHARARRHLAGYRSRGRAVRIAAREIGAELVLAIDPSASMLGVLREGMAAHGIDNVARPRRPLAGGPRSREATLTERSPPTSRSSPTSAMTSRRSVRSSMAMEQATRRECLAVLMERSPAASPRRSGRRSTGSLESRSRRCPPSSTCFARAAASRASTWSSPADGSGRVARRSRRSSDARRGSRPAPRRTGGCASCSTSGWSRPRTAAWS